MEGSVHQGDPQTWAEQQFATVQVADVRRAIETYMANGIILDAKHLKI